jgi:hypothetical protein
VGYCHTLSRSFIPTHFHYSIILSSIKLNLELDASCNVITHLKSAYACACDQLTVVEVETLQVVTHDEQFQTCVSYQRTVVELQHRQAVCHAERAGQVTQSFIRDQLTVRQYL